MNDIRYFCKKTRIFFSFLLGLLVFSSCSSSKMIALYCQERQVEIYVDDEFLGRDLVYYSIPKGREYMEVTCMENGNVIYRRKLNVKDNKGKLIELQIPKNYKYSSKPF